MLGLPAAREHVVQREHRAERVAVGGDVARERDHVGVVDGLRRPGQRVVDALELRVTIVPLRPAPRRPRGSIG